VDAYFKELETLLLKVDMEDSEEAKITRFVSGLRRDIQDVVELQEYSSLGSLVHLAMKVESQLAKKNAFKNSPNDGYYNNSRKNKKAFSMMSLGSYLSQTELGISHMTCLTELLHLSVWVEDPSTFDQYTHHTYKCFTSHNRSCNHKLRKSLL